jgi:hypothetical protein
MNLEDANDVVRRVTDIDIELLRVFAAFSWRFERNVLLLLCYGMIRRDSNGARQQSYRRSGKRECSIHGRFSPLRTYARLNGRAERGDERPCEVLQLLGLARRGH